MPKREGGFGQAEILSTEQLRDLTNYLPAGQHKVIASVMTFSSCRVSECLKLKWKNVSGSHITFIAPDTKTKQTRSFAIHPTLQNILSEWAKEWPFYPLKNQSNIRMKGEDPKPDDFLFKGKKKGTHLTRQCFDNQLRKAFRLMLISGASTHSFRRTGLTAAKNSGMPLADIKAVSGHTSLEALQRYLQTSEQEKEKVVNCFGY